MDNNKKQILSEINKYKGTLVIDAIDHIVRLDGFYEDEEDYYYETISREGEKMRISCVGMLIPLKGKIDDDHYEYLETSFNNALNFYTDKSIWL